MKLILRIGLLGAVLGGLAQAGLILTLDQASLVGAPGTAFTLTASLLNQNAFSEDLVSLSSTTFTSSVLILDSVNVPDFIAFGATYTGVIAHVHIDGAAAPGSYPGQLIGFSYDTLNGRSAVSNSASVLVNVATPEPGTPLLSVIGAIAVLAFGWKRKRVV